MEPFFCSVCIGKLFYVFVVVLQPSNAIWPNDQFLLHVHLKTEFCKSYSAYTSSEREDNGYSRAQILRFFFSSFMPNLLQYVAKWLRIMMNGTDVLFWNRKRNHHFQCFLKYRYWFMPRRRFSFSGVRLLSSGNLCFVLPKTRHNVTVLYVPKHTAAFTSTRYLWLNVLLTLGPGPSFEQYVRSLCYFTFFFLVFTF